VNRIVLLSFFLVSSAFALTRITIPCPDGSNASPDVRCYRIITYNTSGGVAKWKHSWTPSKKRYDIWVGPVGSYVIVDYKEITFHYPDGSTPKLVQEIARKRLSFGSAGDVVAKDVNANDPLNPTATAGYEIRIYHRTLPNGAPFLGRMDKPVVVCQGFDPNYNVEGKDPITGVKRNLTMNADDMVKILGSKMIYDLLDQNYSVVLIMFKDPTASIAWNAEASLDALQWVQQQAVGQDITVIGPSMGGLIMRKALIEAGKRQIKIHPRLFIAYDSPNWGAVVPFPLQAAVRYFKNKDGDKKWTFKNLTSPAASQMLLVQTVKPGRNPSKQSWDGYFAHPDGSMTTTTASVFLRELNSQENWDYIRSLKTQAGNPVQVMAVTDGSPDQNQGLTEGAKYCDYNYTTLWLKLYTGSPGANREVAVFNVFGRNEQKYQYWEPVVTENLPGGFRDSYSGFKYGMDDASYRDGHWRTKFLNYLNPLPPHNVLSYNGHTFIPTVSAAGIRTSDYRTFNYTSSWYFPTGTTQLNSDQSWFDKVYIASKNWIHVSPVNMQPSSPVHGTIMNLIQGLQP